MQQTGSRGGAGQGHDGERASMPGRRPGPGMGSGRDDGRGASMRHGHRGGGDGE